MYEVDVRYGKEDYVWYVSYGSNMLRERFMCYIKGGRFRDNISGHDRCDDPSEPIMKMPYIIPYNMYYANKSRSWEGLGVSFLDITRPGKAYGVAYLISKEQFKHVCEQENGGGVPEYCPNWYNTTVSLGSWDMIPVMTLTNNALRPTNSIGQKYYSVLEEGMKENYPYLSMEEIEAYIMSR